MSVGPSSVRAAIMRPAKALTEVLGTRGRIAGLLAVAAVVAFFYTLLLPFDYTQRFSLANWHLLNAYILTWAIVLGLAMGLVVSVQVYAMRRVAAARAAAGTAGGVAFVASLLPSFLCCTPVVPSVLAFVGVSGAGLYGTTGALQHFFAVHQTGFLSASLALLAAMSWWGLHKIARSACFSDDGCPVPAAPTGEKDRHAGPGTSVLDRGHRATWHDAGRPEPRREGITR